MRLSEKLGHDMIIYGLKSFMIAGLTAGFAAAAYAEDADVGKAEFQASCASCHGVDGKGKGPVAGQLKVPPADLTALAKNNNGVFPITAVYEAIDGRRTISAHGTHEMPIWGERFNPVKSLPHIVDPAYDALDPSRDLREVVVRTRILAIIDYLNRIQQK
ncbi:mono/diheme cytochrome c family protein [Bradyrhizobium japonicum]|jgi:mono/diheme cytochrome c family protein|uniref:Mono/diheme cytochrome c family protein n=4 Tax=Nitrobacteraceae TaxID=41294 RepID=A0A8I1Y7V9_BRAEL|nr:MULTISPECIES: cytochrome c [Bradyrhizobium]MBP1293895.1 mono/diheme cytochrome c family protein [Bradyrhizobium elkanii]MBP2432188.1 mono/diheme cytochrome c family protein [Bradyrhizobium elkanii]MCP1734490.1 mono/diheme cytochrome c family protein [Bradyrhizobium elkanii]MCP1752284.1 mono/diheme cytochrome c family protein [Bradyrhizobium elkanii]MCP1925521.1 mono/diheme cytochrome c family protein [Bradyrhizobium elkanii]